MYKTLLFLLAGAAIAAEVKPLPAPVMTGGMPLMEAINARQSGRKYNPEHKIDDQTLSEILWVAWGINTHGKRTIPTARNKQNMGLYVLTPEGTWRYNAADNALEKVNDKNLIPLCEQQSFVKNAPLHLLYTAKDDRWGRSHVGSAYQNVYLYATSKGLNTVIRGMIDTAALTLELAPGNEHVVIAHQTVGYAD
ncbi:MAG: nitroreductase family protein [Akkermansia sp.]|nr:nitroreductase family protein [Akkermansia sp.]